MRKKLLFVIGGIILAVGIVLGGIKLYRIQDRNQCGILLAFDDYNADNWEGYFDLFDEYGVKATFFICANEPTDFCYDAMERGHEIAFHTAGHQELTALSEEEVYQQAIDPIEVFRDGGIELSTFAYPKGSRNEELDEKLLGHYKVLRGAYFLQITDKHQFREGYVESLSLDNGNYSSQEQYEAQIDDILANLKAGKGRVVSLYSHAIGAGDWSITEDRLLYLLRKAKEMGLRFYTFQELQNW